MLTERMQLSAADRFRYFVPTAICGYLAGLCLVLVATAAFISNLQQAVAVCAAGVFGLVLSGAMGVLFWRAQRLELRYTRVQTGADASANFAAVRSAACRAGWRIVDERRPQELEARTAGTLLDVGERIAVRFRGSDVLVACICDPSVGFSLVGRQHCAMHRELVRQAVGTSEPPAQGAVTARSAAG